MHTKEAIVVEKKDLLFFEKSQYCLTSVFDIPINLVLAVSLLTIYPPGSKQHYYYTESTLTEFLG